MLKQNSQNMVFKIHWRVLFLLCFKLFITSLCNTWVINYNDRGTSLFYYLEVYKVCIPIIRR